MVASPRILAGSKIGKGPVVHLRWANLKQWGGLGKMDEELILGGLAVGRPCDDCASLNGSASHVSGPLAERHCGPRPG
jgi:hypothetical protein